MVFYWLEDVLTVVASVFFSFSARAGLSLGFAWASLISCNVVGLGFDCFDWLCPLPLILVFVPGLALRPYIQAMTHCDTLLCFVSSF